MGITEFLFKQIDYFNYIPTNTFQDKTIKKIMTDQVYYIKYPKACVFDMYCKEDQYETLQPIFINLHGGGFVAGDKKYRDSFCQYVAGFGFKVLNVNHGLAPTYNLSQMLEQLSQIFVWINNNAKTFKLDTNKILLCGDSAGAYLASCLCLLTTNEDYAKAFNLNKIDAKIKAVTLFSGIYFPTQSFNEKMIFNINHSLWEFMCGDKFVDIETCKKNKYYNLIDSGKFVTSTFPPTFISYADRDIFCKGNGDKMVEILRKNKIPLREVHSITNSHDWQETMSTPASKITFKEYDNFLIDFLNDNIKIENNKTTIISKGKVIN